MKTEKVARDNAMFFVVAVGMSLGIGYFTQAVLDSSMEESQFPTDSVGSPGYIRIDSSAIRKGGDKFWDEFVNKIRNGLLGRVSYEFSSATEFKGDFAEHVTIEKDDYTFSFHIKQYERDSAHGFEIIDPENLGNIPEGEQLGRVVCLTITL
jgi:hypothetical protein